MAWPAKKQETSMVSLHYGELNSENIADFIELLDILKTEVGITAQEFRNIREAQQAAKKKYTTTILTEDAVDNLIVQLNDFRKHLNTAGNQTLNMVAMFNRATH